MSSTTEYVCDGCGAKGGGRKERVFNQVYVGSKGQYDVCDPCWDRMVHTLKNKPGAPTAEEIATAVAEATEPLNAAIARFQAENQKWSIEAERLKRVLDVERDERTSDAQDEHEYDERIRRLVDNIAAGIEHKYDLSEDPFDTLEELATELLRDHRSTETRCAELDKALGEERKLHTQTCFARDEILRLATVLAGMIGKKSRKRNAERIAEVERQLGILTGRTP